MKQYDNVSRIEVIKETQVVSKKKKKKTGSVKKNITQVVSKNETQVVSMTFVILQIRIEIKF